MDEVQEVEISGVTVSAEPEAKESTEVKLPMPPPELPSAFMRPRTMEQHLYTHSDMDGARVNVKAEKNSKGWNYEAAVSGAKSVEEAMKLLNAATSALAQMYGAPSGFTMSNETKE